MFKSCSVRSVFDMMYIMLAREQLRYAGHVTNIDERQSSVIHFLRQPTELPLVSCSAVKHLLGPQ